MVKEESNLNPELDYSTERKENESYEDYKERRKQVNKLIKRRLKGFLFWNSSERGTYYTKYLTNVKEV